MSPVSTVFRRSGLLLCSLAAVALAFSVAPARAASGAATAPDPTWGTAPAADRSELVLAVAAVGDTAYLGGDFTTMVPPGAGPAVTRRHLAAVSVAGRSLRSWNPDADGMVRALAASSDGQRLYVGGDFNRIGGVAAPRIALLDPATGAVVRSFRSNVKGRVHSIALSGNRLFVAGDFDQVTGPGGVAVERHKVAALDAATGALLDWAPPPVGNGRYVGHTGTPTPDEPAGSALAVAVSGDGSRVYVGGTFMDMGGQGGLVVLDGTTGAALPQQWTVDRPVLDLDVWPGDGATVFAATGGAGGRIYAFRPDKPTRPLWKAGVDGDAVGVASSSTTVFLTGHYDHIVNKGSKCYQSCPDGTERRHLAAFDAATGAIDPWNPAADTITGPYTVALGAGHVLVGGEFNTINGNDQPGYAQFALPGGSPPPPGPAPSSSSSSSTTTRPPPPAPAPSTTTSTTAKPPKPKPAPKPATTTTTRAPLLGGLFRSR